MTKSFRNEDLSWKNGSTLFNVLKIKLEPTGGGQIEANTLGRV
jgi:hypothetical protein